jgi:hypothetical protein
MVSIPANSVASSGAAGYDPRAALWDIPEPGDDLRLAVLRREQMGGLTLPIRAGLAAPKLWAVATKNGSELTIKFEPLDRRPPQVRPHVWAAFFTRAALDDALADQRSRGQLKQIAAAGLRDLLAWTGPEVAEDLEYSGERAAYAAAERGRALLAHLNAWSWACLPAGVPKPEWWLDPQVRRSWQIWATAA